MGIEFRHCSGPEEMVQYRQLVSYVFAENGPDAMSDELATTQPDWTHCAFVDGRIATTMGVFPFTVRLNGAPVAMGGVTAVGTLPEFRRNGFMRQVMGQALATMRERGQSLAILWASMGAIYQRFGYGLASASVSYEFDPRLAQFADRAEAGGRVTLMPRDEAWPLMKRIYIEYATPRNLLIHRAAALWEEAILRPPKKGDSVYCAVYRNADGEPRGHVVYRTFEAGHSGPGPGQVFEVRDFIALDVDAYRGLWEYIRRHDLVGTVRGRKKWAEDDPATELLLEPRMLNRKTSDGIWMRVVDVEAALPQRPYGERGSFTFALTEDEMCPWNAGTFRLETDGMTTEVRRTGESPQMVMPPNTLASLIAGYRGATHFARAGRLECADPAVLTLADRVFKTAYAPHCPDDF